MAMRSQSVSASSWSWVTKMVVMPIVALDPLQLDLHLVAQLLVERAERLVEQQHARLGDERAGERDALLLAAGQLVRMAVARACRAARGRAPSATRRRDLGLRRRPRTRQAEGDIVGDASYGGTARSSGTPCRCRACGPACRSTLVAVDSDARPRPGSMKPAIDAQQRGLAAAGRSEQAEEARRPGTSTRDVVQRRDGAIGAWRRW